MMFSRSFRRSLKSTFQRGFTMIELIVVIAILGIVTAISVPAFQNLSQSARVAATKGSLGAIRSALAIRYAQSATSGVAAYPGSLALADFMDNKMPKNSLDQATNSTVTNVITTASPVTSSTVTSTTAGFWYVSSGVSAGYVGAFAGPTAGQDSGINVLTF